MLEMEMNKNISESKKISAPLMIKTSKYKILSHIIYINKCFYAYIIAILFIVCNFVQIKFV